VLTPPDAVFGPVWTVLYIMMGISSVQAFKAGARGAPLVLYGAQLAVRRRDIFTFVERERKRERRRAERALEGRERSSGRRRKSRKRKSRRKKTRKRRKKKIFPPHFSLSL
jgi:hypothetical protein